MQAHIFSTAYMWRESDYDCSSKPAHDQEDDAS